MTGPLCDHRWLVICDMPRVPIRADDRVSHTSFQILGCDRCRQVEVFPHENFALIAPGFRVAMGVFLDALGWHLES